MYLSPCAVQVTSFETPGVGPAEAKADTSGTDQKGPVSSFYPILIWLDIPYYLLTAGATGVKLVATR